MSFELQIASTSSSPPSIYDDLLCQVCGQQAHGNHFGAITCRACAAFFRRSARISKTLYKCEARDNCKVIRNGRFACKKCKLRKCLEVGMDPKRFQFGRDLISTSEHFQEARAKFYMNKLPDTIEILSGKPSFIMYLDPQPISKLNYIDLQYLVDEGWKIIQQGAETPFYAKNKLGKLALGLQLAREKAAKSAKDFHLLKKIGKKEAIGFWEKDFLTVAKWLTYFDDFQQLPGDMQILLLKTIWHVWIRLDKLSLTAASRQNQTRSNGDVMLLDKKSGFDPQAVEMDITWFTKYPREKLKYFFDEPHNWMDDGAIIPLIKHQPTDIELTYMFCQLCFQYAGKRYQGEILKVTEKFQESLANDLHDYYTNEMNMPRYCGRLGQLMKINNMIQEDIREKRERRQIAKVFQIYCVEFSHPEMFEDLS